MKLLKSTPAFLLSFGLSVALIALLAQFTTAESAFTYKEAQAKLGKKVKFIDPRIPIESRGKVVFVDYRGGNNQVVIDWDISPRGKHELLWFDKQAYRRWIIEE